MTRRRIIVTDGQERAVLAAIRCLGAAGYEVTTVASSRVAPGLWSRASAARRRAPDARRDVDGFLRRLEALVDGGRYDVLVPGNDSSLLAVSRYRERLEPHVRLGLPEHTIVERCLDKQFLAAAASSAGLTPPEEAVCEGVDEARAAGANFGYPVLVKPRQVVRESGGAAPRWGSVLAGDERVLTAAAERFGSCIVQRRVSGPVISFAGVATGSGMLGFVVSRYARTWPREAGAVCFSETILPAPGLVEKVQALVRSLEWVGLFELELIEAGSDDHAAIDFNPRPYGSLSLATKAGVPLTALWCGWLLGEASPAPRAAQVGTRYRWEDADLTHLIRRLSTGEARAALAVAGPHRHVAHAYFAARDPVPALARAAQIAVNAATRDQASAVHGGWRRRA